MSRTVPVSAILTNSPSQSLMVGQTITFVLSTADSVSVQLASNGRTPALSLNNGAMATYTGQDVSGRLLFNYVAAVGQDTPDLTVTGLDVAGAAITSVGSLALGPPSTYGTVQYPYASVVADLNGDGNPDIVAADIYNNTVSVLFGNGQGSFTQSGSYAVGSQPQSIVSGDFNGDGKVDLAVPDGPNGAISVLLGDGNGGFGQAVTTTTNIGMYSTYVAKSADFNGDGFLDLVSDDIAGNAVQVFLGDGTGRFSSPVSYAVGASPYGLAIADFNGDGKPDVVVVNNQSLSVSVLLGDGQGGLLPAQSYAVGPNPSAIAVGDLRGDGKVDIVVSDQGNRSVSVLLGDGHGGFAPQTSYTVGAGPSSVAIADLNGDGILDIIAANVDDGTISVLLGDGQGGFSPASTFSLAADPGILSVADVNNDGRPDIIAGDAGTSGVSVLLNTSIAPGLALDPSGIAALSGADTGIAVTVASTPPPVPTLAPASDSGTPSDGITNVTRPTLTGTAEAGSTVTLSDTQGGTTTTLTTQAADASGNWTITLPAGLAEGVHSLTVMATNASGIASAASGALALTIDTVAPAAPSLALAPASDSGTPGDGITNVTRPMLTGMAEAGSTVTLTDTQGGTTAILGTATALADGTWSLTPGAPLTEGAHQLAATATDAAGNTGLSQTATLTIDTVAPVPTIQLTDDTAIQGDGITADPSLSGQADPGATVTVTEGGQILGTPTADATGRWDLLPALNPGAHTVTATTTDAAGNAGSATLTFTIDPNATDYSIASGGTAQDGVLSHYTGPVAGIDRQFIYTGVPSATIVARAPNAYIVGGAAGDAIVAQSGRNLLDGGRGANWLVAGTGQDTFMADLRGGQSWNTILGFKTDDDVILRGIDPGLTPQLEWVGQSGVAGYTGATLRITDATGTISQLTLQGLTVTQAERYATALAPDADGTLTLHLTAPGAGATPGLSIVPGGASAPVTGTMDPYQGSIPGLRYQYVEAGGQPVAVAALASDAYLHTGAGADALTVFNGDNVLDAGAGSNWLVGGAGHDSFDVTATAGAEVWDTVLNYHTGDTVTVWGFDPATSNAAWQSAAQGAAGYEGATLRGGLSGAGTDFSITLAGLTPDQGRALTMTNGVENGMSYLRLQS